VRVTVVGINAIGAEIVRGIVGLKGCLVPQPQFATPQPPSPPGRGSRFARHGKYCSVARTRVARRVVVPTKQAVTDGVRPASRCMAAGAWRVAVACRWSCLTTFVQGQPFVASTTINLGPYTRCWSRMNGDMGPMPPSTLHS
jgi:hypothetical protein